MRAANGHPAPFKIKYVEIGNENFASNYEQHHYRAFYDAIKQRYPQITTIADERIAFQPLEIVDDHYYVAPQRFLGLANLYDDADRKGPKIYVGEYAINKDVGSGNLLGALSEAVFAMMMERNSDVVVMASYAPLFENVNRADWPVNLIRFDSSRVFGRTSYYVQKLLSHNRPDVVLKTTATSAKLMYVTTQISQIYAESGLDQKQNQLILKVVNPTPAPASTTVSVKGLAKVGGQAHITTLSSGNPKAENSFDNPKAVYPAESDQPLAGAQFTYNFPPNSFTIIRLPAQ
jgi:alpha-N-arabinofuranosidase